MYPNPQEALPLAPRPNLEHYRKLAKDLVKACKSSDALAIRAWAGRWIDRLSALQHRPKTLQTAGDINAAARRVEEFSRKQFSGSKCSLTTAQFVVARAHGFTSWPKFASHPESLQDKTWNTPPLQWALTGWQRSGHSGEYHKVVAQLVGAGAQVTQSCWPVETSPGPRSPESHRMLTSP